MKKQKMSLEKMKSVLSKTLSREEMKDVMAGSGGGGTVCGACWDGVASYNCYITPFNCGCNGFPSSPCY